MEIPLAPPKTSNARLGPASRPGDAEQRSAIPVIVGVTAGEGYRLTLRSDDGRSGEVDVAALVPFTGVFAPLKERDYFVRVRVDPVAGSIAWPNGADLDPVVLYSAATGGSTD